jgi:hypothetical protein
MEYMSISQAASLWGLNPETIRIRIRKGRIPEAIKEGQNWKIPVDTKPMCFRSYVCNQPPEGYVSAEGAAELSGVKPYIIRSLLQRGKIPGAKKVHTGNTGVWLIPENYRVPVKTEDDRYMNTFEAGRKFNVSHTRVCQLCLMGRVDGAFKDENGHWKIPKDADIPVRPYWWM